MSNVKAKSVEQVKGQIAKGKSQTQAWAASRIWVVIPLPLALCDLPFDLFFES